MENIKAKIQGILLNCSQKSVIGWAVEESDFEHVAEEIVKNLALSGVSQQRELLNGFRQWLIDEKKNINIYQHLIDEYLKAI